MIYLFMYFLYTTDILRTKKKKRYTTDIFRKWMHFVRVNVMFYDAVKMIHDVITTANLFPYASKFTFDGARKIKLNNWEDIKNIKNTYIVLSYTKNI